MTLKSTKEPVILLAKCVYLGLAENCKGKQTGEPQASLGNRVDGLAFIEEKRKLERPRLFFLGCRWGGSWLLLGQKELFLPEGISMLQ